MSRNHITAAYFGEQMFSTLVVVGTLQGNEFGIDLSEYEVGVDFRGVHRIPEGVHYVYATSCDAQGHRGSRTGFVHYFLKNEIVVCEWDMHTEELKLGADVSKAVLENIANAERYSEIEALLLKYNSDEYDTWKTLTNHITSDLLRRIVPTCSIITSAEPVTCSKNASQEQTRENEPCNQHGIVTLREGLVRTLFALLCNSELAVISYGQFYSKLMILLMYHIPMLPLEMVGNIETNTIYKDTRKLLRNTCQTKRASDMQRLLVSLQQTVHWDFPGLLEEDPEDLPTVVTL